MIIRIIILGTYNEWFEKDFSLSRDHEFLELVKTQPPWTVDNLRRLWQQFYDFLAPPKNSSGK
jgi:hypothetical protein